MPCSKPDVDVFKRKIAPKHECTFLWVGEESLTAGLYLSFRFKVSVIKLNLLVGVENMQDVPPNGTNDKNPPRNFCKLSVNVFIMALLDAVGKQECFSSRFVRKSIRNCLCLTMVWNKAVFILCSFTTRHENSWDRSFRASSPHSFVSELICKFQCSTGMKLFWFIFTKVCTRRF